VNPSSPHDPPDEPTRPLRLTVESLADGRYVLGGQLGAGGMGIVRRARDRHLDRDVAVKLLADNLAADPEARERFLRESRAAARIGHPNVVAVHDVGEDLGRPYFVMELIEGPSLAEVLRERGPLDAQQVARIAEDALAGLAKAHASGLVHRDVKPGNLLLGPDGVVKVTDLGVVGADDETGLTRTGFVVGTRSYLAPELRTGAPATPRSDLFALGATLVELLTGRTPPAGSVPEVPAGAPAGLYRLLPRLLAVEADNRPPDAAAALALLRGEDRTTELPSDGPSRASRRRVLAGSTLAVLVALGGVTAASVGGEAVAPETPDVVDLARQDPGPGGPRAEGPGVHRVEDDPAATAENLARWLRGRAESQATE
jgi:eukaryotic-like serine/threonine-protein kinase